VFVVGCLGSWQSAAEVLFESDCLSRNTQKSRGKRQEIAKCITTRIRNDFETESFITKSTFWDGSQVADTLTRTSDDQRMPDKNRFQAVIQSIPIHAQATQYKGN
jgi:hypothetical protein